MSLKPKTPRCISCLNRLTTTSSTPLFQWPSTTSSSNPLFGHQPTRGKKKLAKDSSSLSTVTVRLLKPIPTYGRAGTYVPISVGQMRNIWFPQRVAEYVTYSQMRELKSRNVVAERDFAFGVPSPGEEEAVKAQAVEREREKAGAATARSAKSAVARAVEANTLTPERSSQLVAILLPNRLDFYRQAREVAPAAEAEAEPASATPAQTTPVQRAPRQRSASNAAADLMAARAVQPQKTTSVSASASAAVPIYGSVSTTDVAAAMKAVLAENDEASKVVFGEEDVRFVNVTVDGEVLEQTDRVKHLGEFQVEIHIKGVVLPVKRTVRVLAQDV